MLFILAHTHTARRLQKFTENDPLASHFEACAEVGVRQSLERADWCSADGVPEGPLMDLWCRKIVLWRDCGYGIFGSCSFPHYAVITQIRADSQAGLAAWLSRDILSTQNTAAWQESLGSLLWVLSAEQHLKSPSVSFSS